MTIPVSSSAGDYVVNITAAVLATTMYVPVPANGRIKSFSVTLGAALSGADETFTLSYAPPGSVTYTAVTGGAVLVPNSSSAAGNTVVNTIGTGTTTYVTAGGSLKVVPSGGGSGAVPLGMAIVIGN